MYAKILFRVAELLMRVQQCIVSESEIFPRHLNITIYSFISHRCLRQVGCIVYGALTRPFLYKKVTRRAIP